MNKTINFLYISLFITSINIAQAIDWGLIKKEVSPSSTKKEEAAAGAELKKALADVQPYSDQFKKNFISKTAKGPEFAGKYACQLSKPSLTSYQQKVCGGICALGSYLKYLPDDVLQVFAKKCMCQCLPNDPNAFKVLASKYL